MNRTSSILANTALVIGAFLVPVVVLEVVLRIAESSSEPVRQGQPALCCEQDPLLGWRHKPNTTIEYVTSGQQISQSFNSRGIRGPEYSFEKPPGEYRILIVGDSFAEGMSVNFDEVFSEVMERHLNAKGERQYQAINIGVAGYSTDQQLLLYRDEGTRYEPDVTVLLVYDNDIWFNARKRYTLTNRGYKPMFDLAEGRLKLVYEPGSDVQSNTQANPGNSTARQAPGSIPGVIKRGLNEYSYAYRWVRKQARDIPELRSLFASLGLMDPPDNGIPASYGIYAREYSADTAYAWVMTRALIAEIKREAESRGSKFILAHAPFRATIEDEYWVSFKSQYGVSEDYWSRDRVNAELAAIAGELDITFLNPVKTLRAAAQSEQLYLPDQHWNARGNEVIGDLLAEFILSIDQPGSGAE